MLRILPFAALVLLVACGDPDPPRTTLQWESGTQSSPAPEHVGASVPAYTPPPQLNVSRLQTAMQVAQLPSSVEFLRGPIWEADEPPPGEPKIVYFFGNMVTVVQRDGRTLTHLADYSGSHRACGDYPLCFTTLNTNGSITHHMLHWDGESFAFGECLDITRFPRPTEAEFAAANAQVFFESERVLCFLQANVPRYYDDAMDDVRQARQTQQTPPTQ